MQALASALLATRLDAIQDLGLSTMQRRLFGTDGIRGTSNTYPMTTEVALGLGRVAGSLFRRGNHQNRVVIGKDTRLSGYMIEYALTAGFLSAGMRVMLTGPVPTPAVAFLTRSLRADIGVMVSASHNPFEDNGIKLFGPDGFKLSDAIETEIEAQMADMAANGEAPAAEIGRAMRYEDARGRYVENLKSSFPRGLDLAGRKIVVDCANGAAYHIAPELFFELGAEVISMGVSPTGRNINAACGSTYPAAIQAAVRANGADLGIALDGDADRVVLVDEQGELVDGDQVLALIARSWANDGRLTGGGVVATLMSNFGLEGFMRSLGLDLHRTKVGDRYVVERMRAGGFNVGGEQSGHVVLTDFATTGDGLLAALQVLAVLCRSERPVSEICRAFTPLPQVLKNIRIARAIDLTGPDLAGVLSANTERLHGRGRLVVRPSGTEPLIRVMVEADDEHLLEDVLATVSAAIERETEAG